MSFLERFKGRTSLCGKDVKAAIMETTSCQKPDFYNNNPNSPSPKKEIDQSPVVMSESTPFAKKTKSTSEFTFSQAMQEKQQQNYSQKTNSSEFKMQQKLESRRDTPTYEQENKLSRLGSYISGQNDVQKTPSLPIIHENQFKQRSQSERVMNLNPPQCQPTKIVIDRKLKQQQDDEEFWSTSETQTPLNDYVQNDMQRIRSFIGFYKGNKKFTNIYSSYVDDKQQQQDFNQPLMRTVEIAQYKKKPFAYTNQEDETIFNDYKDKTRSGLNPNQSKIRLSRQMQPQSPTISPASMLQNYSNIFQEKNDKLKNSQLRQSAQFLLAHNNGNFGSSHELNNL